MAWGFRDPRRSAPPPSSPTSTTSRESTTRRRNPVRAAWTAKRQRNTSTEADAAQSHALDGGVGKSRAPDDRDTQNPAADTTRLCVKPKTYLPHASSSAAVRPSTCVESKVRAPHAVDATLCSMAWSF